VEPGADIDQLQEPPGTQGRHRKLGKQFGDGLDIGHRGDATLGQHLESFGNCPKIILHGKGAPQGVDVFDPLGEALLRSEGPAKFRVVEMTMGVDQAGQKRAGAEVDDFLTGPGGQIGSLTHCDNLRSLDSDRATGDRRGRNREDIIREGTTFNSRIAIRVLSATKRIN